MEINQSVCLSEEEKEFMDLLGQNIEIGLVVRNFSSPSRAHFFLERPNWRASIDKGVYACISAAKLFQVLNLNLEELSQIFVEKPWDYYTIPKEKREKQPVAKSYDELETCRAWDDEGWCMLANLFKRPINVHHSHGGDPPEEEERGIYYPNGNYSLVSETRPKFAFVDELDVKIALGQATGTITKSSSKIQ